MLIGCKSIQKNDGINQFLLREIHWDDAYRLLMVTQVLQQPCIGGPGIAFDIGADTRAGIARQMVYTPYTLRGRCKLPYQSGNLIPFGIEITPRQ